MLSAMLYQGSQSPSRYRKINKGNENDLMDAVAQRPVAVGFDAHHPAFKLYDSGVFDIDYCTTHLTCVCHTEDLIPLTV